MVKALTKAGESIPKELKELEDGFRAKVDRGEAQWAKFGFEGKGFTFDADEMNESQKLASMQRKMYEIEQGIVDDEAEVVDDDAEFAADDETTGLGMSITAASSGGDTSVASSSAKSTAVTLGATSSAKVETQAALAKALQLANKFSRPAVSETAHFSDEVEINDYPPLARRRVTNRQALDQITDMTGGSNHLFASKFLYFIVD
jgi:ATP-dependent RNA helicase DDX46/PRP5